MNKNGFIDYIVDLLSDYGNITKRYMFGGCSLYLNKKIFAIIIDDELYFKADKVIAEEFKDFGSRPFTYKLENKTIAMSYWYVPVEVIEDAALLKMWFDKSLKGK
jgi:DNA transformation protein and related proteins